MDKRLLIVGPLPDEKNGLQYGGATVLMKNFVDYLDTNGYEYDFVQTNSVSDTVNKCKDGRRSTVKFLIGFFKKIWRADIIMFNFSDHGVVSLLPKFISTAKALKKTVVLRKFGGSFDLYMSKVSSKKQAVAVSTLKKCDLIFLETLSSISHIKSLVGADIKIEWFPNVRNKTSQKRNSKDFNNRLVFLSHISDEKGVGDILEMSKQLKGRYSINLYGAIKEDKYIDFDWDAHGVNYHGEISSDKVPEVLKDSSLLLLPSYREGYPGIIIEALSVGLPVLSTTAGGIPEMISNGVEGFLITPGDVDSACRYIEELTPSAYTIMCDNALRTFNTKFEAGNINSRIINKILSL